MITAITCVLLAKELIYGKIADVSREYGVSENLMSFIVEHESQYNNCAVGDTFLPKPSLGLVQISTHYNNVSPKDAFNPQFALEYLASSIRLGKANKWSTYKMYLKLYPNKASGSS